jgi:hypothetical protein
MVGWRTVGCVHVASMTCKSSRFLIMSGNRQHAVSFQHTCRASCIILLWCSSSLNRPDSTRASYSFIGPWILSASAVETERVNMSFAVSCTSYIHSFATCAYPLVAAGTDCATAPRGPRALTASPRALLPARMLILQSRHIVRLEFATRPRPLAGIRLGVAWRERVRNPRSASDDVIFEARSSSCSKIASKLQNYKNKISIHSRSTL